MTQAVTIRTTLVISFTLLLCNSIAYAQDGVTTAVEDHAMPVIESEPIETPTNVMPVGKKVDNSNQAVTQPGSSIPQASPGERVTNPAHAILNLDTKLGGVEIKGTKPTDFGYLGPGDMRTHLWNAHSKELIDNGITEFKLMAMTVPEVQKWHNFFHGVEGSPDHPHDDDEHDPSGTIVQQSMMPSVPMYVEDPIHGAIIYENFGYYNSEFSPSEFSQPGIIYQPGVIIEESSPYGFETQVQPMILNQGVIQPEQIDGQTSSRRVIPGE